jgi:hypothetical protein
MGMDYFVVTITATRRPCGTTVCAGRSHEARMGLAGTLSNVLLL